MNVFDMANTEIPTKQPRPSLANRGGLNEIPTENPVGGFGHRRGDGYSYFGGIDGMRYRQPEDDAIPNIREGETELRRVAKTRVFDMTDDTDVEDYQRVMTDCANGQSAFGESDKAYDQDSGSWKIWVRWYELLWEKKGRR